MPRRCGNTPGPTPREKVSMYTKYGLCARLFARVTGQEWTTVRSCTAEFGQTPGRRYAHELSAYTDAELLRYSQAEMLAAARRDRAAATARDYRAAA